MAQNGGIIGPINVTSKGNNTITSKTCTGTITTQPGTRLVHTVVVAGGGGGGSGPTPADTGFSGGGAGGLRNINCISVCGNSPYPITAGGGGAAGSAWPARAGSNGSNSEAGFPSNPITSNGGGGGGGRTYS